jgi:hypothetical protein
VLERVPALVLEQVRLLEQVQPLELVLVQERRLRHRSQEPQ